MRSPLLLLALCSLALAGPAPAEAPKLPSGRAASLLEVIWPEAGAGQKIARFRFVVPGLKKGPRDEADLLALCNAVARPAVAAKGAAVDQVVIAMLSRPTKFGEAHPEVTQIIDAFTIKAGTCEEAPPW